MTAAQTPLLEARGLSKVFRVGGLFARNPQSVQALSDVSLSISRGETVAIVGESGCGKSTLGRCLVRLMEPTSGEILLNGTRVDALLERNPLDFRRAAQIVFQDPYASFNPRRTIGATLNDPLRIHSGGDGSSRLSKARHLLEQVGLPAEFLNRYPHELSGGQRQRVAIARALAPSPEFIVCDEAVSSLDVSVQAQIVNLLRDIQASTNVALLFITHNLHLARRIAHRIAVMYLGQIVEIGDADSVGNSPRHPYSRALFNAALSVRRDFTDGVHARRSEVLSGEVPNPINLPTGCRFHARCSLAEDACRIKEPELRFHSEHGVRCPVTTPVEAH